MASKVTTLSEVFVTVITFERTVTCVLSKVISKIAWFLKHAFTIRIVTLKKQVISLCLWVLYFYHLMPIFGCILEGLSLTLVGCNDSFILNFNVLAVFSVKFSLWLSLFALSLSWSAHRSCAMVRIYLFIVLFLNSLFYNFVR